MTIFISLHADEGTVVIASVLFTTLQSFLPSTSLTRYIHTYNLIHNNIKLVIYSTSGEVQSLIISSQIAMEREDGKMITPVEGSPVTINFQFKLVGLFPRSVILTACNDFPYLRKI